MKILSVQQPWASLIVSGRKDVENRTWRTRHRGPTLIYASATKGFNLRRAWVEQQFGFSPAVEPRGGIIGVVTILECVTAHSSPWFEGPIGWVLADARPLPFTPTPGHQTLRPAPLDLLARLRPYLEGDRHGPI